MNARVFFLIGIVAICSFAQSDQKFKMYGFADMTLTKYFPKEQSSIRGVTMMDERFMASFDHLNLYQEFRPNNRVRFLTEMSYQDKPPNYVDKTRNAMLLPDGMGGMMEMVTAEGGLADTNKYQKGIVNYEWGSFSVERAQMSVYLNRYANLTFGKFITPAGIWNVDHGSPVIMTVNQPSQYTFREIYPKAQLGIMESGTYFAGDVDLNYSVYLSTGRGNPIINKPGELAAGGQLRIGVPLLDEFNIGLSGYTGNQTAVQRSATSTFNMDGTMDLAITDNTIYRYRENVMGADFKLRKSIFMLQSEFNYQMTVNKMREDWAEDSINTHIIATYVLASVDAYRNKNFMITPYAFYEYVRYYNTYNNPNLFLDMHPIVAEGTPEATAANYFNGYMKIMAGLNMRMFTNFGIKTEFNFTRIFQSNQDFMDPTLDPNELAEDPDGLLDVPGVTAQFYVAF